MTYFRSVLSICRTPCKINGYSIEGSRSLDRFARRLGFGPTWTALERPKLTGTPYRTQQIATGCPTHEILMYAQRTDCFQSLVGQAIRRTQATASGKQALGCQTLLSYQHGRALRAAIAIWLLPSTSSLGGTNRCLGSAASSSSRQLSAHDTTACRKSPELDARSLLVMAFQLKTTTPALA